MSSHVVSQGEHLSGIAETYGFRDYTTIWDDPQNSDLRGARSDPHVLLPGDVLHIPDPQAKSLSCGVDQRHRFQVRRRPLKLVVSSNNFMARRFPPRSANSPWTRLAR